MEIYLPPSEDRPISDDHRYGFVETVGGKWKRVNAERAKLIESIPPIEELLPPITEEEIEAAE